VWTPRPGPGAVHFSSPIGNSQGGGGDPFAIEILQPGDQLKDIAVHVDDSPARVIKGIQFTVERRDEERVFIVGDPNGPWNDPFIVPPGAELMGFSGASGWYIDAIKFHFSDGTVSPQYGGSGGDTFFQLHLGEQNQESGRVRGFHGTMSNGAIESLGLIFDPAH
jgi:hypothetical protein